METSVFQRLLARADRPARYTGGEYNSVPPKPDAPVQIAFCFPDLYEVGMSNLGIRILYDIWNARPDTSCELCFCPWHDFADALKEEGVPLFSLASRRPLREFDIVAISVSYELSLSNIVRMLDLAGIPALRSARTDADPIVLIGGLCTVNPALLAPYADVLNIGDGEEQCDSLAALFASAKARAGGDRTETHRLFLDEAGGITGVYVPTRNPNGTKRPVRRAIVTDLDGAPFPVSPLVSNIEAVHDRGVIELFRGCTRGCRFCQAGFLYRPVRERSPETLLKQADAILQNTGYDEMSLSSLSSGDYSHIHELVEGCKALAEAHGATFALPSLRVDSFDAEMVAESRLSSLTFAPEAGTQRLRNVINKNVTEENILSCCETAFASGYTSVKLYFMIGLPTETDADVAGIVDLAKKIKDVFFRTASNKKRFRLGVSTSTFVPKPFTPFQWCAQIPLDEIARKQHFLKAALAANKIDYRYHDPKTSRLEAIFSRADERLAPVVLRAVELGAQFDGWTETFDYDLWMRAFADRGVDPDDYTRAYDLDEPLPWDFVDVGVDKRFLRAEWERAVAEQTTPDCRLGCHGCGVTRLAPCASAKGGGKCSC